MKTLGNIIWLLFGGIITAIEYLIASLLLMITIIGGIWISLTHLIFGLLLAITIIGIPFARQHFKLATLALTPFGKEIVIVG